MAIYLVLSRIRDRGNCFSKVGNTGWWIKMEFAGRSGTKQYDTYMYSVVEIYGSGCRSE